MFKTEFNFEILPLNFDFRLKNKIKKLVTENTVAKALCTEHSWCE